MPDRRPYTAPTVTREEFRLGVFGNYGRLDLGEFQPWETPDPGRKLQLDE
jgi:hypothetical protein